MPPDRGEIRIGRVVLDDEGIRREPWLWIFGHPFRHPWSAISAWSPVEAIARGPSGRERVDRLIVELHTRGAVDWVIRKPGDPRHARLVEALRERLPHLESESLLAQTTQRARE